MTHLAPAALDAPRLEEQGPKTWLDAFRLHRSPSVVRSRSLPSLGAIPTPLAVRLDDPADPSLPVLGIWDGHDSGAALVRNGEVLFAVNEERLTRRKLEVRFPEQSIRACLEYLPAGAAGLSCVAVSTSDVAKTLNRIFPHLKEQYYLIRRRKVATNSSTRAKKALKYRLTELGPNPVSRRLSLWSISRSLRAFGLDQLPIRFVDHHLCHAAGAAYCSGFDAGLAITIDALGDGRSASVWRIDGGELTLLHSIPSTTSFGIFFEHVTNLMNMRELEDEGKVMALADFSFPIPDEQNPLLSLFRIDGCNISSSLSSSALYHQLAEVLWFYPNEQFAYLAQRALEVWIGAWIRNLVESTGLRKIALAGGVTSNIKVNQLVRNLEEVEDVYVFPHMGDGGLALGAAIWEDHQLTRCSRYSLPTAQIGPGFSAAEIDHAVRSASGIEASKPASLSDAVAEILLADGIVLWFQGRMEYGPRSLGGRSILARPDSPLVKNRLNVALKKRVWYQPFCPSILLGDAREMFEDLKGTPNAFMTMGYTVKRQWRDRLAGVTNVDGSCRPQIVNGEKTRFAELLANMKRRTGVGCVLNTSFNVHGEPVVLDPSDAIRMLVDVDADALVLNDWLLVRTTHR